MRIHTAKSNARGCDDTGLDDGVLLSGEGLLQHAAFLDEGGVELDETKTQQTSCDVEGRDDTGGEVEFADDDVEDKAENGAGEDGPEGDLLPPRRNLHVLENLFYGWVDRRRRRGG